MMVMPGGRLRSRELSAWMCVFITVSRNDERSEASRDLRTAPELWVVARARSTRIGL